MNLFVLGIMPAFIGLQFFMSRSPLHVLWHVGVGILMFFPFMAIRALLLNAGILIPDNMTFLSQWLVTFMLDYAIVLLYLFPILLLAIHTKVIRRESSYILATLAAFFMGDAVVFSLFQTTADGAYELLFRPLYYFFMVIAVTKMISRPSWMIAGVLGLMALIMPMTDAFIFMNHYLLAGSSIMFACILAFLIGFFHIKMHNDGI
ncbi:hypothetical protein PVA45_02235 [Entomospira entomophila]|uniref:Uncharacterized protein n=1 Tax=Entomospira entomophila TaxID=2719988 RepID=A0A968G9K3_9SPIO|nr:hypothetical protein [Entomospira entomophilus]NIZ40330.1 hypothetical protein [Entomospira entomophilus]WDI35889.1 hypothetical protein PVA45_02235 [Entomospira entomophilus]